MPLKNAVCGVLLTTIYTPSGRPFRLCFHRFFSPRNIARVPCTLPFVKLPGESYTFKGRNMNKCITFMAAGNCQLEDRAAVLYVSGTSALVTVPVFPRKRNGLFIYIYILVPCNTIQLCVLL